MKIGIDIDDTITDSWECLIPYYSKLFNKTPEELRKSKPYHKSVEDKITLDEYFDIMLPIYDKVIPNVHLKPHVKETIDKLYERGHKVYFITARGRGHTNPYEDSKNFLDKHKIKYEEIYINAGNKAEICNNLGISLFIDDSYRHCKEVADFGIAVLMPETYYNKEYTDIPHFSDWRYVYEYVESRWGNGK